MPAAQRRRVERERRWKREGDPSLARQFARVGVLGWLVVVPALLGIALGRWLDHLFDSGVFYGGVLTVRDGEVSVATREAVINDDLEQLESTVLERFHERDDEERQARVGGKQLELRAAREILRYLNPGRGGMP